MTNRAKSLPKLLPLLFGFFIMGFCDVVGIATSYVKQDFGLSETMAGFIPTMVFVWFFILSIPVALQMNRMGRKRTVQLSNIITFVGMLVPFVHYNYLTCMIGFAMLGIGNTILQVSLNPLVTNVVDSSSLSSTLNAGQVVKAVSSFCGPFIAVFAVSVLGNWKFVFPVFAVLTLISTVWLMATPISEEQTQKGGTTSFRSALSLLKEPYLLLLFVAIVAVVGLDVGINTMTPKLLMERCGTAIEKAGLGSSVYFLCRTAGAFAGTLLLRVISDRKFAVIHILIAILALGALFFVRDQLGILVLVGIMGFVCSSIFAVIYSQAMKYRPDKANEISGLMITGVVGGALTPPLMGVMTDAIGNQSGSLAVILVCAAYLLVSALNLKKECNSRPSRQPAKTAMMPK